MSAEGITLQRFVRGEIAAADFPHREHVRMAFEMLRRHDFAESVLHYSRTLRAMAAGAGAPQAFNQTITVAFLAVIAQRLDAAGGADFADFARGNADLFERSLLARWYRPEELASALARRCFVLPEPSCTRRARSAFSPRLTPRSGICRRGRSASSRLRSSSRRPKSGAVRSNCIDYEAI